MSKTSMVDRVARAMAEKHGWMWEHMSDDPNWTDEKAAFQNYWRQCARAAIEAMREPTWEIQLINGSIYWPAMIDAALSPNKETDR